MAMFFDIVEMTFQTSPGPNRVPLTNDEYIELLDGRTFGKIIVIDEVTGRPILVDPPPLPITKEQVDAERDRRVNAGFTFNGNSYDLRSDKDDHQNMSIAAQIAGIAVANGAADGDLRWADADQDFYWISKDNEKVYMDAKTVIKLLYAASAWKTKNIYFARDLKSMNPIPMNYTDDQFWGGSNV